MYDSLQRCWLRSIPACAGEPRFSGIAVSPFRVYPRVCGGTSRSIATIACALGLSPRVRGNPPHAAAAW